MDDTTNSKRGMGHEQPTRLRSSRRWNANAVTSPAVSIVRFGHVAILELVEQ